MLNGSAYCLIRHHLPINLLLVIIVLFTVLGPVLGAVHGNGLFTHQLPLPHQSHQLVEDLPDLCCMMFSKVGYSMVAGHLVVTQLQHFYITSALTFQPAGGTDAIEVAINVQPQG